MLTRIPSHFRQLALSEISPGQHLVARIAYISDNNVSPLYDSDRRFSKFPGHLENFIAQTTGIPVPEPLMSTRRTSSPRSLVWLRDSSTPMFVINPQQRIVLFNHGCEQMSGWPAEQVLGQRTQPISTPEPHSVEAILSALRPPDAVWQGHAVRCQVVWTHPTAEPEWRTIQYWPVRGTGEQTLLAILGIVEERPPVSSAGDLPQAVPSLAAELAHLRFEHRRRFGEKTLIGNCPAMQRLLVQAQLARQTFAPVLLQGERGTGKEHLARSIHQGHTQTSGAILVLDCQLTPASELKSLFKRLIDTTPTSRANTETPIDTWYFQQIDAAPADVQERLIAALQSPTHERGVRVIASTTVDLEPLIADDKFPRELWYLLSPLTIPLPPLRERGGDLRLLGQFFLEEGNRQREQQVNGFADDVWPLLERYRWPGNLDEFRKVIAEAQAACQTGLITAEHLPFRFRAGVEAQRLGPVSRRNRPLDQILEATEREQIELALAETQHNITLAAELLQINRARLYRRMEQLGLRSSESSPERLDSLEGKPPS